MTECEGFVLGWRGGEPSLLTCRGVKLGTLKLTGREFASLKFVLEREHISTCPNFTGNE